MIGLDAPAPGPNTMAFMNTYFAEHVNTKKAFLIIAAGFEDIMMISLFTYYIFKGSSYRMPLAFALFYTLRAIFSVLTTAFLDSPRFARAAGVHHPEA